MSPASSLLVPARREASRTNPAARERRGEGGRAGRGLAARTVMAVAGGRKAIPGREAH